VEEEMLFSNIISEVVTLKNLNYLQIDGRTENNQFSFGLESVLAVLESLKKTTVSINELSKSKELLKGKLILEHENLLIKSLWQVDQFMTTGLNYDLDDLLAQVSKIQAAEIRSLASDIFTPENMLLVIIGTAKETRLVDRLVAKYLG
jgi:predicted Zn-dependent peptidase